MERGPLPYSIGWKRSGHSNHVYFDHVYIPRLDSQSTRLRREKDGRRLPGTKCKSSLDTFWKVFCLVHERETWNKSTNSHCQPGEKAIRLSCPDEMGHYVEKHLFLIRRHEGWWDLRVSGISGLQNDSGFSGIRFIGTCHPRHFSLKMLSKQLSIGSESGGSPGPWWEARWEGCLIPCLLTHMMSLHQVYK